MRIARFLLGLAAAVLLQLAGTRFVSPFPIAADLFLVLTLLVARAGNPERGMFAGLAAGWAADALSGGPFGVYGLADTVVGYGTARVAQQLVVQRRSSLASIVAAGAAVQSGLVALIGIAFDPGREMPSLTWLPVKVATTVVLVLAWTGLAAAFRSRWARRRRRPSGVLRPGR